MSTYTGATNFQKQSVFLAHPVQLKGNPVIRYRSVSFKLYIRLSNTHIVTEIVVAKL